MAVAELYEAVFMEAFDNKDGRLTKQELEDIVDNKLNDDENLRELMIEEIEKIDAGEDGKVTQQQVEAILAQTFKAQMQGFIDGKIAEADAMDKVQMTAGGRYARQMIQRIIQGFKDRGVECGEGEPFQDL